MSRRSGLGRLGWRARLARWRTRLAFADFRKAYFGETPKPTRETRALPSLLQIVSFDQADAGRVILSAHDCRVVTRNERGQHR